MSRLSSLPKRSMENGYPWVHLLRYERRMGLQKPTTRTRSNPSGPPRYFLVSAFYKYKLLDLRKGELRIINPLLGFVLLVWKRTRNGGVVIVVFRFGNTCKIRCRNRRDVGSNADSFGSLRRLQTPTFALQASPLHHFLPFLSIPTRPQQGFFFLSPSLYILTHTDTCCLCILALVEIIWFVWTMLCEVSAGFVGVI